MPRVSVVIPNYNHARYLGRRIESVLRQRFADIEVLVLDDTSPDASREVAQRYATDARLRLHFNESNSGSAYRQWQRGLAMTTARYVWIAESDDFADATLLAWCPSSTPTRGSDWRSATRGASMPTTPCSEPTSRPGARTASPTTTCRASTSAS
jgi:glycosyltransferase involved in cell wall biosynthesis